MLHDYQKMSIFDQVGSEFLMQDRHDTHVTESVMLDPAFQTSCVMLNLHEKSCTLPDPDIFARHNESQGAKRMVGYTRPEVAAVETKYSYVSFSIQWRKCLDLETCLADTRITAWPLGRQNSIRSFSGLKRIHS